jgi:hypothetical protein
MAILVEFLQQANGKKKSTPVIVAPEAVKLAKPSSRGECVKKTRILTPQAS